MVPPDSPIRDLADIKGKKIGVVGGPLDKSWLLLRGLTQRRHGFDPAVASEPVFGAQPLLTQKVETGEIDAVQNYRSEEHTAELQSLMRISYDVFCMKKRKRQWPSDRNTGVLQLYTI